MADKKKIDKSKLCKRILAGVMVGLMLLGACLTLIYCLANL